MVAAEWKLVSVGSPSSASPGLLGRLALVIVQQIEDEHQQLVWQLAQLHGCRQVRAAAVTGAAVDDAASEGEQAQCQGLQGAAAGAGMAASCLVPACPAARAASWTMGKFFCCGASDHRLQLCDGRKQTWCAMHVKRNVPAVE